MVVRGNLIRGFGAIAGSGGVGLELHPGGAFVHANRFKSNAGGNFVDGTEGGDPHLITDDKPELSPSE